MNKTNIGWTTFTANPLRARNRETGKVGHFCIHASEGCTNCYAAEIQSRYGTGLDFVAQNRDKVEPYLEDKVLQEILRYKGPPARCFICDMTDMFGDWVPDEWIDRIFATMALQPRLTFQVLTKRPERMREYLRDSAYRGEMVGIEAERESGISRWDYGNGDPTWRFPLPNLWLGTTCENQHWADQRIPLLLDTPAAVRFVSVEPMLGPVDLVHGRGGTWDLLEGIDFGRLDDWGSMDLPAIGWLIIGAESGRNRRPFELQWARDLAAQCQAAGVAVFCKQGSALRPGQPFGDPQLDALKQFPALAIEAAEA